MKVLIAARHVPTGRLKIGGVQSWCATVASKLQDVTYWEPGDPLTGAYDIGIFANVGDTLKATHLCKKVVAVSHGIIAPERPIIPNTLFTSEEVRDHWGGTGEIIRQPIDLGFWHPIKAKKRYLVRFSYRDGLGFIPDIAKQIGLKYIHLKDSPPEEVREVLQQAACVIATGRAAVEAMACGVPVVICDDRGYIEPLLDPDTLGSMARNYSGRGGITPTEQNVLAEIEKAIERGSLREHAEQHHDSSVIVDQILDMAT